MNQIYISFVALKKLYIIWVLSTKQILPRLGKTSFSEQR